jgi:cholest-4-en-3-one 26-monooxygenase
MALPPDASTAAPDTTPLDEVRVVDRENWEEGPPHALFKRLRSECPVHWTDGITEYPSEAGFWSVTRADDVHTVSRDWETYSSAHGITTVSDAVMPLELIQAMFIGMDPPKHDRLKALFQRGFTPKRIAEHEPEIRAIATRVLGGLEGRESAELVYDVAQPVVSRVIGSFMGIPEEDDALWARLMTAVLGAGDEDLNPEGTEARCPRSSSAAAR